MIPYSRTATSYLTYLEINSPGAQQPDITQNQTAAEFFFNHRGADLHAALTAAIAECDPSQTTDVAIGLIWNSDAPSASVVELLEDAGFQLQAGQHHPFYTYINSPQAAWLDSQLQQYLRDQAEQSKDDNDACTLWFYCKDGSREVADFGLLLMAEHPHHGRAEKMLATLQQTLADYFAPAFASGYRL